MQDQVTLHNLPTILKNDILRILQTNQGNKITSELIFGLHAQIGRVIDAGLKEHVNLLEPVVITGPQDLVGEIPNG